MIKYVGINLITEDIYRNSPQKTVKIIEKMKEDLTRNI